MVRVTRELLPLHSIEDVGNYPKEPIEGYVQNQQTREITYSHRYRVSFGN